MRSPLKYVIFMEGMKIHVLRNAKGPSRYIFLWSFYLLTRPLHKLVYEF